MHMHPYVMEEPARQRQHELRRWTERYGQLRSRRLRRPRLGASRLSLGTHPRPAPLDE